MMRLVTDYEQDERPAKPAAKSDNEWPPEVDMILSAMEAARADAAEHRLEPRRHHRARAELQLFAHDPLQPPIALFTRDLSRSGMGFITRERLPLGYGGLVAIPLRDNHTITVQCNIYRCREAINGWYEGALTFSVEQPELK
ncbi:MAG: PilZ domain-containing protein [Tepidisphaeraceae bacterium]